MTIHDIFYSIDERNKTNQKNSVHIFPPFFGNKNKTGLLGVVVLMGGCDRAKVFDVLKKRGISRFNPQQQEFAICFVSEKKDLQFSNSLAAKHPVSTMMVF